MITRDELERQVQMVIAHVDRAVASEGGWWRAIDD